MKQIIFILFNTITSACTQLHYKSSINYNPKYNLTQHEVELKKIDLISNQFNFNWGGFSGLVYKNTSTNGDIYFYSITDRGPNAFEIKQNNLILRPFYMPDFTPSIITLKYSKNLTSVSIESILPLKTSDKNLFTGYPPQEVNEFQKIETPTDFNLNIIKNAKSGIDSESLCVDKNGNFWVGEEYYPAILKFSPNGLLQKMIKPSSKNIPLNKNEIKYVYNYRKINRGIEALTCKDNKIYFLTQSPLEPKNVSDNKKTQIIRLGVFDIDKEMQTEEYLIELPNKKIDKFGDITMINSTSFLAILQNGETGKESQHLIVKLDISKSTNVINLEKKFYETEELSKLKESIQFVHLATEFNLSDLGYDQYEKVEGLTLINNNQIAVINDNDFGLSQNKIDAKKSSSLGLITISP